MEGLAKQNTGYKLGPCKTKINEVIAPNINKDQLTGIDNKYEFQ